MEKTVITIVTEKESNNPDRKSFNFRIVISEEIIKEIAKIEGVDNVFNENRYGISLYKGEKFSWEEVEKNLKPLFENIWNQKEDKKRKKGAVAQG